MAVDTLKHKSYHWDDMNCVKNGKFGQVYENVAALQLANTIYPRLEDITKAYLLTSFDKVKVVILGQDPYYRAGQATGLAFAVPDHVKAPPSLRNIIKEIGVQPVSNDLVYLAEQGVLLLNSTLTVEADKPLSHANIGWQQITDETISFISDKKDHVVFMLWGNFAKRKAKLIDESKHLILTAAHPSPFSANKGFFGCNHFNLANDWLLEHNLSRINWSGQNIVKVYINES